MIETVRADKVRPGDIMSTNGARIESAVLCQSPDLEDEVCIMFSFEDGTQRFEYVSPSLPVHLWREDS